MTLMQVLDVCALMVARNTLATSLEVTLDG